MEANITKSDISETDLNVFKEILLYVGEFANNSVWYSPRNEG